MFVQISGNDLCLKKASFDILPIAFFSSKIKDKPRKKTIIILTYVVIISVDDSLELTDIITFTKQNILLYLRLNGFNHLLTQRQAGEGVVILLRRLKRLVLL